MSASRRFRVSRLPDGPMALEAGPAHHLVHVLRISEGARVTVFDGRGQELSVEVVSIDGVRVQVAPVGPIETAAPTRPAGLLLAQLKPKALDVAIRMAVEAGTTHIDIFPTQRSLKRPARLERWHRLAEAAARQCGRADLPDILASDSLSSALNGAITRDFRLFVALPGTPALPAPAKPAAVLIGPEGGLDEREIQLSLDASARPVGLGQWVLRADTAAAIASAWVSQPPAPQP